MERDFIDPPLEETEIVLVDRTMIEKAQRSIAGCEACGPEDAETPFDWILDRITGKDLSVADYLLEASACCPGCRREIHEKTLVEVED